MPCVPPAATGKTGVEDITDDIAATRVGETKSAGRLRQ